MSSLGGERTSWLLTELLAYWKRSLCNPGANGGTVPTRAGDQGNELSTWSWVHVQILVDLLQPNANPAEEFAVGPDAETGFSILGDGPVS